MSNITKDYKKVNASGLRKPEYKQNNVTVISNRKGGIRSDIERNVSSDTYDIYDLVADMANALNEVLAADSTLSGAAIDKYKARQAQILNIKNKY